LIRGPAGAGKSQLALALLDTVRPGRLPFARLVADDRVALVAAHGRLIASAPEAIRGLIEVRGLGIRRMEYQPSAVVGLVVDLAASDAARLPPSGALKTEVMEIGLPRLPIAPGEDPLPLVLACISTAAQA
jgi:serine kinase of HPr protein (carbohydrate metabolism regulator)